MIKITLPWFQNDCRPNARVHWAKKMRAKNIDKELGYYNALPFKNKLGNGRIKTEITFYPPSNRSYDGDNCIGAIKGQIDGIALGFGVNDKNFRPTTYDFGGVIKNGKVVYKFDNR